MKLTLIFDTRTQFVLLIFSLAHLPSTFSTPRVVVTFHSAETASQPYSIENVTVVKQYGRRLVIDLGREVLLDEDGPWIRENIGYDLVENVELDLVIKLTQMVFGQSDIVVDDFLTVETDNSMNTSNSVLNISYDLLSASTQDTPLSGTSWTVNPTASTLNPSGPKPTAPLTWWWPS